jgi:hypothetical protein
LDAAHRSIRAHSRLRWRGSALLLLASLAACAALSESLARGLFWLRGGVPAGAPDRLLEALYPEIAPLREHPPARGDASLDLLLLGGSVLHESWGQVEAQLLEQLARARLRGVRVHNLAQVAHTTRDSLVKYAALEAARFDLVVVYHGINDARANNAPPELFRDDYSHLPWYELVSALAPSEGPARVALPAALRLAAARLHQTLRPGRYAGADRPRPEWLRFGAELRSAPVFEANLAAILERAARRGDRMVLATFALHVPPDYSLAAFRERRLDYLLFHSPLELWGEPSHVVAAVEAHNAAIRRLAARFPEAVLVDQDRLMLRGARFFNDPCHLTLEGSEAFARHLVDAILPLLGARP